MTNPWPDLTQFTDDIFELIFVFQNHGDLIKIFLKFVPVCQINSTDSCKRLLDIRGQKNT